MPLLFFSVSAEPFAVQALLFLNKMAQISFKVFQVGFIEVSVMLFKCFHKVSFGVNGNFMHKKGSKNAAHYSACRTRNDKSHFAS